MPTVSKRERTVAGIRSLPTIHTDGERLLKVDTGARRVWIEPDSYTFEPVVTVDIKSSINGVWYERLEVYRHPESVVWLHDGAFSRHTGKYEHTGR